ncbi:uncharacterized protein LOC118513494 [Anopheles stephensi]|uniref:uncharacterized protein LOC118513494 n=1 Tax=Anopheles stephensi TaxID=30069 RepID=UPI00165881E1|nr:uncharacterized protein LOC118513494 [Anopheles stephensi]
MHPEEAAMDSDEAPEYGFRNVNSIRNVNGIRNLNVVFLNRDRKHPIIQLRTDKKNSKGWLFIKLLLITVCLAGFVGYESNYNLRQDLKNHYYKTYEKLSQLSNDLCSKRQANFTPILEAIDRDIVGQQHLHDELKNWFQAIGNSSFSCALFVGGTGVGKSYTANIIVKHYPYPTNVLIISIGEKKRYNAFKTALFKILRDPIILGKCAHYIIVLDYLKTNDMPLLKKISDRLRAVSNAYHLVLQALFVFQGTEQNIHPEEDMIKEIIPEARLIKFTSLHTKHLEYCVLREASTIGIDLSERDFIVPMVTNQINVSRHGCKSVRAKISLYSV